ncbi:MAG: hypothetical protein K4H23_04765 [Mollicutes bacterium PWAP]|nr:hypothetical protein [Mollicutes bacterium PWAP]
MSFKPLYSAGNIKSVAVHKQEKEQTQIISGFKKVENLDNFIPSSVFKIINRERIRQLSLFSSYFLMALLSVSLFLFFWIVLEIKNYSLIIPSGLFTYFIFRFAFICNEINYFSKSISRYRDELKRGAGENIPGFIPKLLLKLNARQVRHFWSMIFGVFFIGLTVLLFWFIKDVDFWVFHFHNWINNFINPIIVVWLYIAFTSFAISLFLIMTIHRKKQIALIRQFYGNNIISDDELKEKRKKWNRFYSILFIGLIMILVVIPMLIFGILRLIKRNPVVNL